LAGKHISYSEWKNWHICPHYHKLTYIDKVTQFEGNIFTAFGKALHTVCEYTLTSPEKYRKAGAIEALVKAQFLKELKALPEGEQQRAKRDFKLKEWLVSGLEIVPDLYRCLTEKFGKLGEDWEVLKAEEQLYVPITEFTEAEKKFKGFIDLVVYSKKDEKVHLIDWKTCSWGWRREKKSDTILAYQLVFYKHFYARKYEVDPKDVDCHFVLLKRTAKAGKKAEFVRVTAAKKRTTNALNALTKALHNINKQNYIKNRNACTNCKDRFGTCEFYQTEHCS
jgi:23S rRNA maturation mini-RNase III